MKVNAHLKRSRHGVYYYRAVIPKELKSDLGFAEIKRSLGTKDPKQAKSISLAIQALLKVYGFDFLKMLTLKNRTLDELENMIKNFPDFNFTHIAKMMVRDQHTGLELYADPALKGDKELLFEVLDRLQKRNSLVSSQTPSNSGNFTESSFKLSELTEKWILSLNSKDQDKKTVDEYKSKLLRFNCYVKDIHVDQISKSLMNDFVVDLRVGKITGQSLKPASVNKYLCALNSFFNYAEISGAWPAGKPYPTVGHRVNTKKKNKSISYKKFTREDLQKIFAPENLLNWKNLGGDDHRPHMTWLPLLSLFTGARIEELVQLHLRDVYLDESEDEHGNLHKVWVIDINDEDSKKSLKNESAMRKIPLHPQLINLGFLDYIEDVRKHVSPQANIFPYIVPNKYNRLSGSTGKWFARYLDKLEIKDELKVFHSFRTTANDTLKIAGVQEESRCQMVGHAHDTINSTNYTLEHTPKWLLDNVVPKLQFKTLDFTGLKYEKGSYVSILEKLLKKKTSKVKNLKIRKQKFLM